MTRESTRHKELKQAAIEWLKNQGHIDIRVEYLLHPNDETLSLYRGTSYLKLDVVALDGIKKVIEIGYIAHGSDHKKTILEAHGFKFYHWPYSEVKRIPYELWFELIQLNPDPIIAIRQLLKNQKPRKIEIDEDILKKIEAAAKEGAEKAIQEARN